MIRFFRTYQRAAFVILIIMAGALVMSLGLDFGGRGTAGNSNSSAIEIGSTKISHADFYQRKRETENRYRQIFGAQYDVAVKQLNLNVAQNVVDELIENTLLVKDARARGFEASNEEVSAELGKIFPNGFDPARMRAIGKTPAELKGEIEDSIVRRQLETILQDASLASDTEARAQWAKAHASYSVSYIALDPKQLLSAIVEPSIEELKAFYDDNGEDFRTPARVAYDYVAISNNDVLGDVVIPDEEIEFEYTENQARYQEPEQLKLRHIQLLFPKESDPSKLSAVKEKALEALGKAKAGEPFASLVQKYSDDFTTRSAGGDLGWVPRGRYSSAFDDKTYAVKDGGIADLIEEEYGYHIVKVEGYREEKTKPLAEVRNAIKSELQREQAPAYADAKAREFFVKVTESDAPFAELAKASGLTVRKTSRLLQAGTDEDPSLAGLTEAVLENIDQEQLVERKDSSVVVSVIERREAEIPPLETVRSAVTAAYKRAKSVELARTRAQQVVDALKAGSDIRAAAKSTSTTVQQATGLTPAKGFAAPLNAPALSEYITSDSAEPRVITSEGRSFVIVVDKRDVPAASAIKPEELQLAKNQETDALARQRVQAYTEALKAAAEIKVDTAILVSKES